MQKITKLCLDKFSDLLESENLSYQTFGTLEVYTNSRDGDIVIKSGIDVILIAKEGRE